MKTLICSLDAYNDESVFVINIDNELIWHLKMGIEQSINLSNIGFKNDSILCIPYEGKGIELYSFGTIFKIRLQKETEEISNTGIEYLALDEKDRIEFAKRHNLPFHYTLIEDKALLRNFQPIMENGRILFENGIVNFQIFNGKQDVISTSIPTEYFMKIILNL